MTEQTTTYAPLDSLKEFHKAFNVTPFIEQPDEYGRRKMMSLRTKLISEEYREVMDELLDFQNGDGSYLSLAKELADLLYVIYGTAQLLDMPLDKVFNEVHASNMSKLDDEGKPLLRNDGKILKGPNYFEADVAKVLGVSA